MRKKSSSPDIWKIGFSINVSSFILFLFFVLSVGNNFKEKASNLLKDDKQTYLKLIATNYISI
jgi:hypothetical protein